MVTRFTNFYTLRNNSNITRMKKRASIFQLQYLIIETGIVGEYKIENTTKDNPCYGSSRRSTWTTNSKGDIIEFTSIIVRCDFDVNPNDKGPSPLQKVLTFKYRTKYQIHNQFINLDTKKDQQLIWNLSELLFRHKCIIQQLYIEHPDLKKNNFSQHTDSFYYTYQEVTQILEE